ncbi:hypothetical protein BN1013_01974 [Candidatus Rubidus massiliensis]|nr:hypothetical protein BN1013_01974 [Candidatus Rubidus massiliensis]
MKRLSRFKNLFFILLAFSSTRLMAQNFCEELIQESVPFRCISEPSLEVKTGYYFFSNSKMRKIYNKGGFDIQLCASYPVWNLSKWSLDAYGAIEYFHKSGRSINGHQRTSFWSVPVNIGIKPIYAINENMQYYFAIGPRVFYIHQHNRSSYVNKNNSKSGVGFFVNTGLQFLLCDQLSIDVFGEYSYAKTHFHSGNSRIYTRNIQIGGFTFGGGLGYQF